ncbi:MAG: DUF3892 domain-containing protein [Candidatus Poribacteria bacterium]|nr:DUF3892 domain-containing protein [Candidatus Poribacteria bacterium]
MTKWADYAIVTVRYDADHSRIIRVKRRTDTGDKLENEINKTRTEIVDSIRSGKTYVTARKEAKSKWVKGDAVKIIKLGDTDFIRTDGNETKKDNLGELPEF